MTVVTTKLTCRVGVYLPSSHVAWRGGHPRRVVGAMVVAWLLLLSQLSLEAESI